MSWGDLFVLAIGLTYGVSFTIVFRSNRRLLKVLREMTDAGSHTFEGLTRVIHALSYRDSESGWVQLTEEEWEESKEADVKIFREPGEGVRILAK